MDNRSGGISVSNIPSKERLYELYWAKHRSFNAIGSEYNVNTRVVSGWFQAYGIPYGQNHNQRAYAFRQLTKQRLYEMCWGEQLGTTEITERYNIGKKTVSKQLQRKGIPHPGKGNHNAWVFRMLSRDRLYELYWGEGLTQRQIAERYGVSDHFVHELYREREIPQEPARPPEFSGDSIPQGYEWPDDHPRADDSHHQHEPLPENPDGSKYMVTDDPLFDKSELYRLYWGLGLSVEHIAAREDVNDDTVRRHLRDHGIPIRQWSNHLRWEPHHGVPPKYEWPPEKEWTETEAQATSDYDGARWRAPAAE